MLKAMRSGAKSWVAKGLVVLLIVSFAVWGIGDIFSFRLDSRVAQVGEREVSASTFANALERARSRLTQQAGEVVSIADMRTLGIDQRILHGLMRDAAFEEELAAFGISAPDAAVTETIRANPAFQGPGGAFSTQNYELNLARLGYAPQQFEELTRTLLGQDLLEGLAATSAPVPPGMAARMAAHRGEQRSAAYVVLTPDLAPDPGLPGDDDLDAHYRANEADYIRPERRSGVYLHVDIAALAEKQTPSEEEIAAAYEADRDVFGQPASRTIDQLSLPADRAEELAGRVKSGATDFAALAEELGENPADLSLGRVREDDLPPATAEAVFAATEPGVVGPVSTPAGPVLIRITEVTEGGTIPLEQVRDLISLRLARDAAVYEAPEMANRIEDARAGGATMAEIATAVGLPLERFEGLAEDGTLADGSRATDFAGAPEFTEEVFAALDHEERALAETEEGGFFLVLVEEIKPSALAPLAEIRERVIADWQAAQREDALLAQAEALAGEISSGRSLDDISLTLDVDLGTTGAFPRTAPPAYLAPETVEALFAADAGTPVHGPMRGQEGVVLAVLTEITPLSPALLAAQTGSIEAEMRGLMRQDSREFFARAVQESYPGFIDQAALQEVFALLGGAREQGY